MLSEYIFSQLTVVPQRVYVRLLALLIIGSITLLAIYKKKSFRKIAWLFLVEYVFFVLGVTVLYRSIVLIKFYFTPLWSYVSIIRDGNTKILYETILNMVLFVPIGMLWGAITSKWPKKWQSVSSVLLGITLSIIIEFLQYYFRKGYIETDDVIHNTLGCIIGFVFWRSCYRLFKRV